MLNELIDFIFPKRCVNCGSYENNYICDDCANFLKQYEPESYLTRKKSKNWEVEKNLKANLLLEQVFYFYEYDSILQSLFLDIKYKKHLYKIEKLFDLLENAMEYKKINIKDFDLLTFIPQEKNRFFDRGFNLSRKLTEEIARKNSQPFCQIVEKIKRTQSQASLKRDARMKNLIDAFKIKAELPVKITHQKILIIDDIFTTGTTMKECAKTIKDSFPECKIFGLAIARGK
jgi:ComF family protein